MEENIEEQIIAESSNETLSDLRELTIQCRALLHQLSFINRPTHTDRAEASDLMASFNIWAANMGVFRTGRQSLTFRLKSAPDISKLVQQLLVALKRNLEKTLLRINSKEDSSSTSGSDDSSDRSSTSSYKQLHAFKDEKAPLPLQSTIWTPIQNTITSLRQLALTVRRAGAQHRQERVQRFKNLDRNKQIYQLFQKRARETVDHLFRNASEVLRERMATSIATRRARFLYLEQYQKKTSTLNEPAPELQGNKGAKNKEEGMSAFKLERERVAGLKPVGQSSEVFSNTIVTKLDLKRLNPGWNKAQRAGSVASVQIPASRFPSIPKLDPGGISFTCPYCFLICPAKEASGQSQWRSHLIHDFEPFFCVFDDCSSPFTCADTYTGWLAHMRDAHTQPEWYCWHCKTASYPLSPFSTSEELEDHLKNHHREEITDSLRSTLVKHSMIRDQYALHECPFCNGFPEEIEKNYRNRDSEQARESLSKHVRDHLVSVALILAPLETGESGGELDDTKSEAQRDNNSERDFDGVGDTYELECGKSSCDCKDSEKSSIFDWPTDPDHDGWEMKDMRAASDITQLWRYILDEKMSGNWMNPTQEPSTTRVKLNQLPQRPPSPIVKSPNFDKRDASQKGHSSTLSNMATMASIYRSRGQWDAAEKLEMEVMETSSAVLGPEHSATLNSVANLASIYQIQTRWKEAELLLTRVIESGKTVLGPEHPLTLNSLVSLALIYQKQKRWNEAESLLLQVIETEKGVLGPDHPDTLTIMASLASMYQNQNRPKEAELLFMQVVEIRGTVLGPDHPLTLTSKANLASIYWEQGRREEAESLEVEVMDMRKMVLGPEHPDTLASMANLAFTWKSQGRERDALTLMRQCVEGRIQVLGRKHRVTQSSLSILENWRREATPIVDVK